ncbi:MAG TPA: TonB-dependent receptor, partial [Nevskiaceae bacterium]|nr:TonB-dependent receptor [Nevskiaceae bacterium]
GPQGTLFGRNAIGGAIRIITRDPALDAPEGSFQAVLAENHTRNVRGYLSTPVLGDKLAVSVAAYDNIRDATADGRYGGPGDVHTLPRERADGVRGKLAFQPFDNLEFHLASYLFMQDAVGSLYAPNTEPSLLTQIATGFAPGQDPYEGEVNAPPVFEIKNTTTFGRARWGLPWLDIRGYGSQQSQNNTQATDFDGTPMPLAKFQGHTFLDVDSAELQLVSNDTSPGAGWLEWIVGAYWFKSRGGITANLSAAGTDLSLDAPEVLGIPIPENLVEVFAPLVGALPFPGGDVNASGILRTKSIAGFAQATMSLPADLSLTLGGRYQDEKRVLEESSARLINLDGSSVPISPVYSGDDDPQYRDTTKSFDPKVSLAWRPEGAWLGSDPLLYVSWQTATKSSTFNVINLTDGPERVKAEHMEAYEVGFKTVLLDAARLHFAVFHYEIDDPQVQVVSLLNGGSVSFENAGSARVKGIDFDALIQLFPDLTDGGLVLILSGAYLDTAYTSYTDGSGFQPDTGIFTRGNDYTGNEIVRAPEYSGTAGLNYTMPTTWGPVEAGVSYYYNGGFYYLAQGTSNVEEEAYGTLGVSLSWLYEPWNVRATVFGRNVTGERYNIGRFIVDFGSTDAVAERSTWGLRLNWDF